MSTLNTLDRAKNLVHLNLTQDPNVVRFRLGVARTLDDAYIGQSGSPLNGVAGAGTDQFLVVEQGADYISTGLRRKKLGIIEESGRGLTTIKYDPDEFVGGTFPGAPPDQDFAYVRVEEFRRALDDYGPEGPIHIIVSSGFFSMPAPVINVAGTAPLIVGTAAGSPALPGSMVVVNPKFFGSFALTNTGANSIFVSFEPGMPMRAIPSATELSLTGVNSNLLILAATVGATTFSMTASVLNTAI